MEITMNTSAFNDLSFDELFLLDGGDWSWKAFASDTIKGGVGGAIGGAVAGSTAGGVGAAPGALAGGLVGAAGGAVGYLIAGWW